MISIVIPVYNQAKKLEKCLASIKNQTYENYEIIIINDGSTDNIEEIYQKYKNLFGLKIDITSQVNSGSNSARNIGFKRAKGEFLLFCDADLILNLDMLKVMHNMLVYNLDASYVYSSFLYGHKKFKLWPFDAEKLKQMPYIHSTSLVRREHFPKNGWDESLKRLQDWDVWLTMLENGHTGIWIDKILFKVQSGGTISNWLPSFFYKLLPFLPKVKKYKQAVNIIKKKHNLI
jgi:glycosyltransferase involved in cell wall biosynthesis